MNLGSAQSASGHGSSKKLKVSDFMPEAERILKECTAKTLAELLMDKAKCKQQNEELKSQLELNATRIRFVEENNALLMKDMDQVCRDRTHC